MTYRRLAVLFFLLYALAVTWPGVTLFNRIRPFVLGMPFTMAWVSLWVVLGGIALLLLDRAVHRDER